MDLNDLLRSNIRNFKPYSSARHEYNQPDAILLDANENSFGSVSETNFNRYPDPFHTDLKNKLSNIKKIPTQNIFLGNGSDEAIDLIMRAYCEPTKEKVLITPPTYGMYAVCAAINNVEVVEVTLNQDFDLDIEKILEKLDRNVKLAFICSPNNPTGNCLSKTAIESILKHISGLVVIDEAYIDFSKVESWVYSLNKYNNLIILQTFSKAWGLAALRLGIAYAHSDIIKILNYVKYPYNVNELTQRTVIDILSHEHKKEALVQQILSQRLWLERHLLSISGVEKIYPSEANFLLVKFHDAQKTYEHLLANKVIVRDRSNIIRCNECLRITVGTPEQNKLLIKTLNSL
jgi:histidinol-phosphate aminotransferase